MTSHFKARLLHMFSKWQCSNDFWATLDADFIRIGHHLISIDYNFYVLFNGGKKKGELSCKSELLL